MTTPSPLEALGIKTVSLDDILRGVIPEPKAEARKAEALLRLIREAHKAGLERPPRINSPRAAGAFLMPLTKGMTEEVFGVLALNAKGDYLGHKTISMGTCTATLISPREFFREALRMGATSALAYHNHPSGDPAPSKEDAQLTRRLRAAGESLGIPLADHIILGHDTFHSFRAAEGWDAVV